MPRLRTVLLALGAAALLVAPARGEVLLPPQEGLYLSGHPDCGLRDETVTSKGVRDFVALTGRPLVWSYLSWHWDGRSPFPAEACRVLHREGVVPLVGILPWSTGEQNRPEPRVTLKALLAADQSPEVRQVAMVDAQGRVAAHTGSRCIPAAGHIAGEQFTVEANLMGNDRVWPAMARAYASREMWDQAEARLRRARAILPEDGAWSARILLLGHIQSLPRQDRAMWIQLLG